MTGLAGKRQKNPLSFCFSDPDLTLCQLWFDRGEDRSLSDMTGLKHTEPGYTTLQPYIQKYKDLLGEFVLVTPCDMWYAWFALTNGFSIIEHSVVLSHLTIDSNRCWVFRAETSV